MKGAAMQNRKRTQIPVENGYVICPKCRVNKKAMQILPNTTIRNGVMWCRVCRASTIVNVVDGKCYITERIK